MKIAMCWLFIGLVLIPLCGFDTFRYDPVTFENQIVESIAYRQKKVTFKDSMVWYDQLPPTRGILFPVGEYPLEAKCAQYYFFNISFLP
jgi:hypothetical protein